MSQRGRQLIQSQAFILFAQAVKVFRKQLVFLCEKRKEDFLLRLEIIVNGGTG